MSKTVRSVLTVLAVATAALAAAPPVDLPGWAALLIAALAAGFGALGIVPPTFEVHKARDLTIARKGKTPATSVETPVLGKSEHPPRRRTRNTTPKAIVGSLRGLTALVACLVACLVALVPAAGASTAPNTRHLDALVAKWPAGKVHHIALPRRTAKLRHEVTAHASSCSDGYFPLSAYYPQPYGAQAQPLYFCSPNYLHFGDAQYFLAYGFNWCTGWGCDTQSWSAIRLNSVGHGMFASPTQDITTRYSSTYLQTTIFWFEPDNRTFCWYRTKLSGADGENFSGPDSMPIVGVGDMAWDCGPY